ncbi:MAG TPA: SEC-C metal-binding domain-containing protein, partial [Haloferula sp.]
DDVMNKQREVVYGYRNEVLSTEQPRDLVDEIIEKVIPQKVEGFLADRDEANPDYNELLHWVNSTLPIPFTAQDLEATAKTAEDISNTLVARVKEAYGHRVDGLPPEILDQEERRMMLAAIDRQWQAHLYNMDALREGVHLRAQGQKDPLVEYKVEAYELFQTLMASIEQEALQNLFRAAGNLEAILRQLHGMPLQLHGGEEPGTRGPALLQESDTGEVKINLPKRRPPSFNIGGSSDAIESGEPNRNAPCPCGSGKKYKQCHGKEA